MSKAPSRDDAETTDQPATLLSLPKLPPPTEELRQLRREGVHVHRIRFDSATAERERQATCAGLARLPSRRARMWFWQACTIADWYEGTHEMSEQTLRHDLDRAGEFPCWADFERETLQKPLAELHAHSDFRVHYQVQRRKGKVVAVRFHLAPAKEDKEGAGAAP